jgi:hypothetical protein
MGKFPVISISLKGANGNDFETARAMMRSIIGSEAMRFQFLQDSIRLSDKEKEAYDQLTTIGKRGQLPLTSSLSFFILRRANINLIS